MDGRGPADRHPQARRRATLLMVFNAHHDVVKFTLPPCFEGRGWVDCSTRTSGILPNAEFKTGAVYDVTGRSLLLFERAPEKSG